MQALGRFRALGDLSTTESQFQVTLAPGLDPYVWSLSDPARSLGLQVVEMMGLPVQLQAGTDTHLFYGAVGFDGQAALSSIQRDQRVVSAAFMGSRDTSRDNDLAIASAASVVEESRPTPGQPPFQLPGYIPKDPRTQALTWEEKALAATPATGGAPRESATTSGLVLLGLALVGASLLFGRK